MANRWEMFCSHTVDLYESVCLSDQSVWKSTAWCNTNTDCLKLMFWKIDSLSSDTASLFSCSLNFSLSFSHSYLSMSPFLTPDWRRHCLIVYGLRNTWGKTLSLTTNSWVFALNCTAGRSEHKHNSVWLSVFSVHVLFGSVSIREIVDIFCLALGQLCHEIWTLVEFTCTDSYHKASLRAAWKSSILCNVKCQAEKW